MSDQSRWSRLTKLGGLTSRLTGAALRERVAGAFMDAPGRQDLRRKLHLDQAREVVTTLGRLKGAALKVGQQIALAADHLDLPDDVRQALGALHDKAEPVPFDEIVRALTDELGGPLDRHFAEITPEPLGTASLAQAHLARLPDGREVVIKVLHAGVREGVETDLLALRTMLTSGRALGRPKAELDDVFNEIRATLLRELDYLQEAANINTFRALYGDLPWLELPELHPALCTERVLVMDRVHGVPLDVFVAQADAETRQRVGLQLAELFFRMAFERRLLHADPHPGNYLFQADGRIGLLDFGCLKPLDEFWIGSYARVAHAATDGDREATLRAIRDVGAWTGSSPGAADALWALCEAIVAPWQGGPYTLGGAEDRLLERVTPLAAELWRYDEIRGARDMLLLHRTLGGMVAMARKLGTRADWGALVRYWTRHAIAVAAGRAAPTARLPSPVLAPIA